ncbi:MAG TPA: tRNA (adenosine(37)-N6)-threonylcarbamoyltransferase complex dimerization subunit type 1 TsaB [Solirubrobacteraceae bacterium]|nr:tRNA (adenosine(37)-N6)-threonylcarbamoyltransferase complex dimerization subunit type 1 TsaB [Solirubrobacteraceae bacterium]
MTILAMDTATAATAVALDRGDCAVFEARHDPAAGERPGHASRLLGLIEETLAAAGVALDDVGRLAVGTGPGSYTGLRIGVATARALAQAHGAQLVGVSTLRALAEGAAEREGRGARLAVLDARRGEAFAAAWRDGEELLAPAALAPAALARAAAGLPRPVLAIGEGTLRFRHEIEPAGAAIPPDDDPIHRVSAAPMCRLARAAEPGAREAVLPEYLRLPDAEIARRRA